MSSFIRSIALSPRTLITGSATHVKIPASGWYPYRGESAARATAELRGFDNADVNIAIETATDIRSPDSGQTELWTVDVDSTGAGMQDPENTSLSIAGKLFYRIVWIVKTESGSGTAIVNVCGGNVELYD